MSEERAHHPFGPSKLQNLEACPCYESLNSTSEKARLGTLQHTVVETGQDDMQLSDDEAAAAAECIEFFEGKKKLWEEARLHAASVLSEQLAGDDSHPDAHWGEADAQVPAVLELSELYLPIDDEQVERFVGTTGGYLDKALIDHTGQHAMLFDWKFGAWQVEKAGNNLQGIAYALGVFKAYLTVECVEFYFKQPHINSISHAVFSRDDVPALYLRVLTVVERARKARELKDFSTARATIPGCLFCANIAVCPAVTEFACKVGSKFHPIDEVIDDITPTKVHDANSAAGMRLASLVTTWAQAFKSLTTDRVLRGAAPVPDGYEIVLGTGKRKIIDSQKFKEASLRFISEETYNASTEPQLGKIEKAVKDSAPRGQKDSTLDQFKNSLLESGAVEKGHSYPYLKAKSSDDEDV